MWRDDLNTPRVDRRTMSRDDLNTLRVDALRTFLKMGEKNLRFQKITWLVWTGPKYPRISDYQNPLLTLESFSNDHGKGKENGKNSCLRATKEIGDVCTQAIKRATGLIYEQTTLHEHHAFSLQNCDVKLPNFTFYERREHETAIYLIILFSAN